MTDFSKWAKRTAPAPLHLPQRRAPVTSDGAPNVAGAPRVQPVTTVTGAGLVTAVPHPTRAVAPLAQSRTYAGSQRKRSFIVKTNPMEEDRYASLLERSADLMAGVEKTGHDAMQMAGRIIDPAAQYTGWTPATRHYVGVSDMTSKGDFGGLKQERDAQMARGD